MQQLAGQRARATAELRIVLVQAVLALDDQLAVGEERIVLAIVRNVRALHVDLFGVRRPAERVLRRTPIVAAVRFRRAANEQLAPVRGHLKATAGFGAQLNVVLGPGDLRLRIAGDVALQGDIGTDGELVAVVQDDVGREGNCDWLVGGELQRVRREQHKCLLD